MEIAEYIIGGFVALAALTVIFPFHVGGIAFLLLWLGKISK